MRSLVAVEERQPREVALALCLDPDLHDGVLVEHAVALAVKLVEVVSDLRICREVGF